MSLLLFYVTIVVMSPLLFMSLLLFYVTIVLCHYCCFMSLLLFYVTIVILCHHCCFMSLLLFYVTIVVLCHYCCIKPPFLLFLKLDIYICLDISNVNSNFHYHVLAIKMASVADTALNHSLTHSLHYIILNGLYKDVHSGRKGNNYVAKVTAKRR